MMMVGFQVVIRSSKSSECQHCSTQHHTLLFLVRKNRYQSRFFIISTSDISKDQPQTFTLEFLLQPFLFLFCSFYCTSIYLSDLMKFYFLCFNETKRNDPIIMHFFPPLCSIYLAYKGRGIVTSIQKAHLRLALSHKYFRHEVWIELDRHRVYESYFYNCTRFTDIYFAQTCMAQGHDFGDVVKIDS